MPKAILAIRTYPVTVILAMLLFLATLVITTGSMGKVTTGGGDSGDGGSGIGGTGRSGEFGGSGFGGTGDPAPFFTSADTDDHKTDDSEAGDIAVPITAEKALIAEELITEELKVQMASMPDQPEPDKPAAMELQRAITDSVEQNALMQQSELILAADDIPEDIATAPAEEVVISQPMQIVEAPQLEIPLMPASREPETHYQNSASRQEYELAAGADSTSEESAPTAESATEMSMLLEQQAETVPVKLETAESGEPEIDRRNLPDRIQRPDLPPIQRIRPVERVSIMPPRVQPMRI